MKKALFLTLSSVVVSSAWALNWSGNVSYSANETISENIVIDGDVTVTVAQGITLELNGVISGTGSLTYVLEGEKSYVYVNGTQNTYDGPTTVSMATDKAEFYFASIANFGTACSFGCPSTLEQSQVSFPGVAGKVHYIGTTNAETDRPIDSRNCWFYIDKNNVTWTVNGPWSGTTCFFRTNASGSKFIVNSFLPESVTSIARTNGSEFYLMCKTNAAAATSINLAAGPLVVNCLKDAGVPCSLGVGAADKYINFSQTSSGVGELRYIGDEDVQCNRRLQITTASAAANYDSPWHGCKLNNASADAFVRFSGAVKLSSSKYYPWLILDGIGDGELASDLPGVLSLAKIGTGTWSYAGADNSGGLVRVAQGRLDVNGCICATCPAGYDYKLAVTNQNCVLGGTGTVECAASVAAGSTVRPGTAETLGTLTFSDDLAMADGSRIVIRMGEEASDKLVVGGSLLTVGAVELELELVGGLTSLPPGSYDLMECADVGGGLQLVGDFPPGTSLVRENGKLSLRIPEGQVKWVGDGTANAWNFTALNWAGGRAFFDGMAVLFDDTGSATPSIDISETVQPLSVEVNASAKAYVFAGNGELSGSGAFTKTGTAKFTNAARCSYNGATTVEAGSYELQGMLDGSSIEVKDGASFVQTKTGVIAGENLTLKFGYTDETNVLAGTNTFTGTVLCDYYNNPVEAKRYFRLSNDKALGNASSVRLVGCGTTSNGGFFFQLDDGVCISNVTARAGDATKPAGRRLYIGSRSNGHAQWRGDIIQDSAYGASLYLHSDNAGGIFDVGDVSGTNVVDATATAASVVFRGSGTVNAYSRLLPGGTQVISRTDPGRAVLFSRESVYKTLTVDNGTIAPGAADVFPHGVTLNLGSASKTTGYVAQIDLAGFDQTCAVLKEQNTDADKICPTILSSLGAPATLTLSNTTACTFGSWKAYLKGQVSIRKLGSAKFTLGGSNEATGTVEVAEGTLALTTDTALNRNTQVVIGAADGSKGILSIGGGLSPTCETLTVGGVVMGRGTYGSLSSAAQNKMACFGGTGVLNVRKPTGLMLFLR